jgi:ABC-type branched-subunit amino acid transport system substrate-binding protein
MGPSVLPTVGPTASAAQVTVGPGGPTGTAAGVTPTTIKIGVYTANGFGSFAAQFGASIATGNNTSQAQAVIDYLNKHGGIAGRKIVPVFHDFDITAAQTNIATEYQAACDTWVHDNRVYAMVTPVGTADDTLYECLSKAGVVTVSAGDSKDATFFQKYGDWFYEPTDMNLRRILVTMVDGLSGAGFFGARPKIGVVFPDVPNDNAAVEHGLKPALARHGLKLEAAFAAPTDASAQPAYKNAVLRFKAAGITHVLFTSASSPFQFMADSESQQYHPRYGLESKNSPSTLQGISSASAQRGAMGIGWQPMNDVDAAHDPGTISARQALCLKLMKDSGQDTSARATAVFGLWYCDNLLFLRDALLHAPSFAPAGLRQGAESLTSLESATTFRSRLGPNLLHDGACAYRVFAFKDDCSCYQYVSPLRPAS